MSILIQTRACNRSFCCTECSMVDSARLGRATITVINAGTNAQRVATTDNDGRFTVPNLASATYIVRVELAGFNTVELKDFVVRNGEIAKPSITLSVASVAESVNVAASSPLL